MLALEYKQQLSENSYSDPVENTMYRDGTVKFPLGGVPIRYQAFETTKVWTYGTTSKTPNIERYIIISRGKVRLFLDVLQH